jgi:hypothetical protein
MSSKLIAYPFRSFDINKINLQIFSDCSLTTDYLRFINNDNSYKYIIIHIGICDSFIRYPENIKFCDSTTQWKQNVSINDFEKNISNFIRKCSSNTYIALVSIIKPDKKFLHIRDFNYNNILENEINKYNNVLNSFCAKHKNVFYVDLKSEINNILTKYSIHYDDMFCDASGHITNSQDKIDMYSEIWKNSILKIPIFPVLLKS